MTKRRRPSGRVLLQAGSPWQLPPPWLRAWRRDWFTGDLTAGLVVAIMLVPQSLAYALLAGLPPQAGLLASLLPLIAYAVFGSSASLSVGPAAITSLMVYQALTPLAAPGSTAYVALSALLALGSGLLMLGMGWLRMGFLSQLLSRPVVQGFTVASAVLILLGQLAPILGWRTLGQTLPDMLRTVTVHADAAQAAGADAVFETGDLWVGLAALMLLWLGPRVVEALARARRWPSAPVQVATRLWPLFVLIAASWLGHVLVQNPAYRVARVGAVSLDFGAALEALGQGAGAGLDFWGLLMPVVLISLVSFVSSMSVAQTFALRHGQRVDADRELLGLGLANVGSAILGGMAVSGGLSRSVVNEAAGARSPLAGVITSLFLAVLLWCFLPWIAYLPKAALAAVIITAVVGLVDIKGLRAAWAYDRADAWAFVATALGVLMVGFDAGILLGMAWSLGAMIWRHSQPHMAEVGRLPGTAHFRNVQRHDVEQLDGVLMVRVDESLDFTNIQRVEARFCELVHARDGIDHIVLLLSAVNHIDHSAMQTLLELSDNLREQGKHLYLAEIKGPVMDRLKACQLDRSFEGRVFMSAQHAWDALSGLSEKGNSK
ncbi:SulP family inorganic anion transporter [Aquabacterium sp.]|uniref:SulP family inorganic anion transporter n=1 Tax=Aquabacterium sp. TaxID=1872578 RepID=UPI002E34F40E|nr:SulP family inorganic anion transporter [Aquabacterium sp.]HEX5310883.1 SulP family inorganic anion transporter [Aquabacterium sp.]